MASHDALELILEKIRDGRNFDFRSYKRATLRRRIERRMSHRRCSTVAEYANLLDRVPDEYDALVSSMLIKVTSFFRDPETWEYLRSKVVPKLVERRKAGQELRVWSAGCATGEEAYSIAFLIAEALGSAQANAQVKVFGTDVDEAAIATARHGVYDARAVEGLSPERRSRFFQQGPGGWVVSKDVRRMVVFGVNNLVTDAPISRLDLLLCRNVFIYLDAQMQRRVLTRFHYALRPQGVLVLGRSELIPFAAKIFEPLDLHRRLYVRGASDGKEIVDQERIIGIIEQQGVARAVRQTQDEPSTPGELHRLVLQAMPQPVIATSGDGVVSLWNGAAARMWRRSEADVLGKRLTSLGLPGLPGELLIEKTAQVREGKAARETALASLETGDGNPLQLSIAVSPLRDAGGGPAGFVYVADDVTLLRRVERELHDAQEERQEAVEDLQTANEEMQSSNEELETTNEELQSANEELQSTNEELETTNEELQSTNAELDATNRELAHRTDELNFLSFCQRTIIRSLSAAVIVVDTQGRITLWNLAAERLLGLTEAEAAGQLLWTLRVPVLTRTLVSKVRKSLAKKLALRPEDIAYERPGGARGRAKLSAIPLVQEGRELGALILLEDMGRAAEAEDHARKPGAAPARRRRGDSAPRA